HVGPDDVVSLLAGIGAGPDLRLEVALGRLVGHVHAGALAVELPAMVHAAQPLLLVAAEEERGSAMRAGVLDESELPGGCPETDQVLAEEPDAHGGTVRSRKLVGGESGDPVLTHEIAHGRSASDPAEQLVIFSGQHGGPPAIARVVLY